MAALDDVTAVIPVKRDGNKEWLHQAINSLGKGAKYLVIENDGELADAWNEGVRQADTEFVFFFSSDDIAGPGMAEELRAAIWDVDVAYPSMTLVSEDLSEREGDFPALPFDGMRLQQENFVSGCSMARRSKVLEVGGFRDVEACEDWDLWVRMFRAGAKFKPVPTAMLYYRQHPKSRSRTEPDWPELRRTIVGEDDPTLACKATFYYAATPAVAYLRCQLPARYLPGIASDRLEIAQGEDGYGYPWHRGAAVFQLAADKTMALMATQLQMDGFRVLVETDDNYFAGGAKAFRKKANWGAKIGDAPHTVEGHRSIVSKADGVIVTTDYLASQYRKVNPNVYVVPNQVDPSDWQPLDKPDDGVFRVGWYASASHQHTGDERLIRRAFEWLSRQKDCVPVVMGFDPRWPFRYEYLPYTTDLSGYRQAMQYVDVGVAPVVPTPFTRARSDIKALEYLMAGALPVVSEIECYDQIPEGVALKAKNPRGFLDQIQWASRNQDEVKRIAVSGRRWVLEERTVQANIDKWSDAVVG